MNASETARQNKETIRRIYAALEQGDRSVFGESVHPDYVWRLAGHSDWSRRFDGRESIHRDLLGPLYNLFSDTYAAQAVNLIAEGDQVAAEVRGKVLTKSGQRYDNEYCFVFRFRDGKIAEVVEYCDTDLCARALGRYDDAVAAYRSRA